MDLFTSCPKGVEGLLAEEVRAVGGAEARERRSGVEWRGGLREAYALCMWSRVGSRVLLPLATLAAPTPEALYEGAKAVPWEEHVGERATISVDATLSRSAMTHSKYAALKLKDAVVDRLRDLRGVRPDVDVREPDVRINLRVDRDRATVSIDLSGDALHRRGYREPGEQSAAPLKENLAAAVLLRAGWMRIAAEGGAFLDPMCGSGTLPIEAATIAADIAPGLLRARWGFTGWLGHDDAVWAAVLADAGERRRAGVPGIAGRIFGGDSDPRVLAMARANAGRAGLGDVVRFELRDAGDAEPPAGARHGLVAVNPPYGERLGDVERLGELYAALGVRMRAAFGGWEAAVLTGNPSLASDIPLRPRKVHTLYNGAIESKLLLYSVSAGTAPAAARKPSAPAVISPSAHEFANRLRKDYRHLGKWARREGVTCWRVYDHDMPDYAVAVDLYEGAGTDAGKRWAVVAEYEAPPEIDPRRAEQRLREAVHLVPDALGLGSGDVFVKTRRRQRGGSQYEREERREPRVVSEAGLLFEVDLAGHLDTGLFLDHRTTRAMIGEMSAGKRFLNLYSYTGSVTVYAAAGGARSTTSVDLSKTYLDWAGRNLELNRIAGPRHELVRADALPWMEEQATSGGRYDLVFLDPPTFSRGKRMEGTLDVQRDHPHLVRAAAALLAPEGTLVFSNNFRRFKMEPALLEEFDAEDITKRTIPEDFRRNPRIHNCWAIRRREDAR